MYILKACAVCFSTDVKLYSLNLGQLRQEFHLISGIQVCIVYYRKDRRKVINDLFYYYVNAQACSTGAIGLQTSCGDGLPDYLCYQCTALVRSFKRFRDKCHRARYALKELLSIKKQVTIIP